MFKKLLHSNFLNKEIVILLIFYLSLIASFLFGENSTGGAVIDYAASKKIIKQFSLNFLDTLYTYDSFPTRHSPVLLIMISFFDKLNFSDHLIRFIHLHICLLLPFFFYKCLNINFKDVGKKILFLLTLLIFLSPTFRTLSVWPDSRIIGLLFFTLGILFYLKFLKQENFKYVILNTFCIVCSAYFSPNFSLFSVFFIINFASHYGFKSQKIFLILLLNIVLAIPAIYFIFYEGINFLSKTAAIGIDANQKIFFNNIFNDILITFSLFFFYLLPFIITKIIHNDNPFTKYNILFSFLIFLFCLVNFDYNYSYSGGGIFLHISNLIFSNNILFYIIGFISIFICLPLLTRNKFNILIFFLILLNNPQYTIYHKYFDPFFLILFFTIFDFKLQLEKITNKRNYLIVFFYFLSFLIISNLKYLWKI